MPYITLTLAPSASQQADLDKLLVAQQTAGSANYHQWLTPEEYAQRFGVSDADRRQNQPMASKDRDCGFFRWRAGGTGSR